MKTMYTYQITIQKTVLLMLILFTTTLITAQSNLDLKTENAIIKTTAIVETLIEPDRYYIKVSINPAELKNNTTVEDIEDQLKKMMISLGMNLESQLAFINIHNTYKHRFLRKSKKHNAKVYTIMTKNIDQSWNLIRKAKKLGISYARLIGVGYSKEEKTLLELRRKAVEKSRIQAEQMVIPLSKTIKEVISIIDDNDKTTLKNKRVDRFNTHFGGCGVYSIVDIDTYLGLHMNKLRYTCEVDVMFKIED